jgi:ATP adenylyltransferase
MEYVSRAGGDDAGCVFCNLLAAGDDENSHILFRDESVFVLLNAFPYNTGHLMVAPTRHAGELHDLTPAELAWVMELTSRSVDIIGEAMMVSMSA